MSSKNESSMDAMFGGGGSERLKMGKDRNAESAPAGSSSAEFEPVGSGSKGPGRLRFDGGGGGAAQGGGDDGFGALNQGQRAGGSGRVRLDNRMDVATSGGGGDVDIFSLGARTGPTSRADADAGMNELLPGRGLRADRQHGPQGGSDLDGMIGVGGARMGSGPGKTRASMENIFDKNAPAPAGPPTPATRGSMDGALSRQKVTAGPPAAKPKDTGVNDVFSGDPTDRIALRKKQTSSLDDMFGGPPSKGGGSGGGGKDARGSSMDDPFRRK